ncbi:S-layer homology domain-containing protein [Paenibacillus brevis]|uniref:S-layer homology domain-containing protein n=1 Tax=Paenibacillus brevis TaxID=2841508 RepID=A0ABS6FQS7_9BACL|nr:S-layer homology domain-containing protein [Paenibacillus brevis]MBU5671490.1 S-layer homology domain-containing protein [Paenibacillus brevis]
MNKMISASQRSNKDGKKRGRIATIIAAAVLAATVLLPGQEVYAKHDVQGSIEQHTREAIVQKMKEYAPLQPEAGYLWEEAYEERPSITAPYSSGKLKDAYILEGIKAVNLARYLAGLPDDVQPDYALGKQQQAAALLNAINGQLSHYPSQPSGMNEDLYRIGANAAKSSNIAYGADTFREAVFDLYMADSGESNMDRVGHRRWILNPVMKKTMFGAVVGQSGTIEVPYSNMYSFDASRAAGEVVYDQIAWPSAGQFPLEVWHDKDPWSVSLNPDIYDNKRTNGIKVKMTRKADGKVWSLDPSDQNKGGKYFKVDTGYYAIPFCIIFRPDSSIKYNPEDQFHIEITGLYSKANGQSVSIAYDTQFFTAGQQEESISESQTHPQTNLQNESSDATVSSWAQEYYLKLKSNALLDGVADINHSRQISRQEFTTIAFNLYQYLTSYEMQEAASPFADIDQSKISHAAKLGIIQGTSAGLFSPDKQLTRQEAVVVLMNLHKKLGGNIAALRNTNAIFADDAQIASWAKADAYAAYNLGFIQGTGANQFQPKANLTKEQVYVMLAKLMEKYTR